MQKQLLFVLTTLLVNSFNSQTDTSLIYYDLGVRAFQNKAYSLADSMFTISARLRPHPNTYFSRAAARNRLNDRKGYCEDICYSSAYGDKEAYVLFENHCGTIDTVFYASETRISDRENHAFKKIIYASDYEKANFFIKFDKDNYFLETSFFGKDLDSIHWLVDEPAEYIEGIETMYRWIGKNIRFPAEAREQGLSGKVYLKVHITRLGYVGQIAIHKGMNDCKSCNDEALRVVSRFRRFKPARIKGQPVESWHIIPIAFRII